MWKGLNIVGAKRSDNSDREKNDYYATDPKSITDLAKFVDIKWVVWENACGGWNMSKELEKLPWITKLISTDLIDRWYEKMDRQLDFLSDHYLPVMADIVITNFPYKHWKQWVEKSLKYAPICCFLCKLVFLESADRYKFFKTIWLKKVLVYSKRLWVYKDNIKTKNSWLVAYCWMIFERWYKWEVILDWIL